MEIKCKSCPECGSEVYGNGDVGGKGYRECSSCGQDWWTDIDYPTHIRKTLIPLSDFILKVGKNSKRNDYLAKVFFNYAKFLKTEIEKSMFVQCDENGDFFSEDIEDEKLCKFCHCSEDDRRITQFSSGCEGSFCNSAMDNFNDQLEDAKNKIFFEDFNNSHSDTVLHKTGLLRVYFNKNLTIENFIKYNLVLTENAQKIIWNT